MVLVGKQKSLSFLLSELQVKPINFLYLKLIPSANRGGTPFSAWTE